MKHYLIYQIRNKLNGMIYIGQHQTENVDDGYMGSGLRIRRAIEKYGLENFEKTILFECKSEEEMNTKEAEIVNEDFIARDDVYNIMLGGEGGWKSIKSCGASKGGKQTAKKLKAQHLTPFKIFLNSLTTEEYNQYWKDHPHAESFRCDWTGRKHSIETKRKISEKAKNSCGKLNNQYGKMWICNDETHESKSIPKTDPIPKGWRKGRFCKIAGQSNSSSRGP